MLGLTSSEQLNVGMTWEIRKERMKRRRTRRRCSINDASNNGIRGIECSEA